MKETSKTLAKRRQNGWFDRVFVGTGIDIGCGDDPLPGVAVMWDVLDGDAQYMQRARNDYFDYVYSSHSLEHMESIPVALRHWLRILKPGGWATIIVPDYTLYEHHQWPSMNNGDHKHSFSLTLRREVVKRENHWHIDNDIRPILRQHGCDLMYSELEHDGYDFNIGPHIDQTMGNAAAQILMLIVKWKPGDVR